MTQNSNARTQYLKDSVAMGSTVCDIAHDLDITKKAAQAALRIRGLRAVSKDMQTLRQQVAQMTHREAVEYLLDYVDLLGDALNLSGSFRAADSLSLVKPLTPKQKDLLEMFLPRRALSVEEISARLWPGPKENWRNRKTTLHPMISHINAAIPKDLGRIVYISGGKYQLAMPIEPEEGTRE